MALFLLLMAPAAARAQAQAEQITLRPGDLLRVAIWREGDLSGDFQVDEQGRVTLPLLGVRTVTNVPMAALRDSLMREYLKQLRNPSITITPLRRVNILGEVQHPGLYPVDPTVSLAGAVALAGGAGPEGDLTRISVLREGSPPMQRLSVGASLDQLDVRSGDQIVVGRRSWGARNSGTLVASALSFITAVTTTYLVLHK
jgi:polysaccharide export outer membrane protein